MEGSDFRNINIVKRWQENLSQWKLRARKASYTCAVILVNNSSNRSSTMWPTISRTLSTAITGFAAELLPDAGAAPLVVGHALSGGAGAAAFAGAGVAVLDCPGLALSLELGSTALRAELG